MKPCGSPNFRQKEDDVLKKTEKKKHLSRKARKTLSCYAILSPQIIGVLVFSLYPILWAASKAFYYYTGTPSATRFVGFDNFLKIFTIDSTYWQTWGNTLLFAFGKLPLELPFALLVALCLRKGLKGAGFFRAAFYLPCVISIAIVGLIFTNLFDYFGLINAWLTKLGLIEAPIEWFSNPWMARFALIIGSIWSSFGINVLYFISALANVPEELYECARLDGASRWVMFRKITLPMIAPVFSTILLLAINGTLQTSEYILATTRGAPGGSTYTVMSYVVNRFVPGFAEVNTNVGYGCALSLVTAVLMGLIAVLYSKLTAKLQNIY